MDYQLKDKRAFISGSTSGIGLATAKMLAAEGCEVIINGRSETSVKAALDTFSKEVKSHVSGLVSDFSDFESVNHLVERLADIDILINNVGIFTSQSFDQTPDDDWFKMFEVNVMSGVRLSKALLPKMKDKGWGRIIFVSSECASLVPEDLIAYGATKAMVQAVARGLAQTTRGTQVTVNTVSPGSTMTSGARRFLEDEANSQNKSIDEVATDFFTEIRTSSIIQRFAEEDEIAQLITYLASPLSSATTGAVLSAEGGSVPGIR